MIRLFLFALRKEISESCDSVYDLVLNLAGLQVPETRLAHQSLHEIRRMGAHLIRVASLISLHPISVSPLMPTMQITGLRNWHSKNKPIPFAV